MGFWTRIPAAEFFSTMMSFGDGTVSSKSAWAEI